GIIHQHVVNLGSRHTIATRTVDPNSDVSASCHQFLFKKSRRDLIVIPALFRNRPIQEKHPLNHLFAGSLVPDPPAFPVPKLLHPTPPPFRCHSPPRTSRHPAASSCYR